MSEKNSVAQTIALAGVLQSAYLVDHIARTGNAPNDSFNSSINSLFQFDADSAEAVYGGLEGVKLGLQILCDILSGNKHTSYTTVIRYAMGILHVQRKLSNNNELLNIIHNRLQHTALKAEHFSDNTNSTATCIAAIYQDTVSTFNYRIQIHGSMQQLQNSQNADKIRALLLAGIRGAVLWRQSGGKRWQFLLSRGRLLKCARQLLNTL